MPQNFTNIRKKEEALKKFWQRQIESLIQGNGSSPFFANFCQINDFNEKTAQRNPFARVYSAYHDKMRATPKWIKAFQKYFVAIEPFQPYFGAIPEGMRTSFESFLEFIATNRGQAGHNAHWRSIFSLCSACAMDFNYITHLENSKEEIPSLLRELGLYGKIHIDGQYNWDEKTHGKVKNRRDTESTERPPDELHWQNVPRKTAIEIYRHYYLDFVLFGYLTKDVMK